MEQSNAIQEMLSANTLSISVFRIGVIFFTVLTVKILFIIFKYNIRMLAFYKSRKYANQLSGLRSLDRVKTFADVWASEKIDFDKDDINPKTVSEMLKVFGK
jgi:hypothetical protein